MKIEKFCAKLLSDLGDIWLHEKIQINEKSFLLIVSGDIVNEIVVQEDHGNGPEEVAVLYPDPSGCTIPEKELTIALKKLACRVAEVIDEEIGKLVKETKKLEKKWQELLELGQK